LCGGFRERDFAMSDTELNAEIAGNKLNLKNLPIGTIALVAVLFLSLAGLYFQWEHKAQAAFTESKTNTAIDKLTSSQIFFACIIAQPQDERMKQFENEHSFCNRMAKGR
jgi:hypothetical protein